MLYGEWVYMTHSVRYSSLPGLFVAFDLLDRAAGGFVDRHSLAHILRGSGIPQVLLRDPLGLAAGAPRASPCDPTRIPQVLRPSLQV